MKFAAVFTALGLIAAAGSAAAQSGVVAIPSGMNTQMFAVFRRWCLDAPPSFDALDARATSAHLRVSGDDKAKQADGTDVETKTWFYTLESGNYAISAVKAVRGNETMSVCNVLGTAADAKMADFLSESGRFGAPMKQSPNKETTLWNGPFPDTTIRFGLRRSGAGYEGVLSIMQTVETGK